MAKNCRKILKKSTLNIVQKPLEFLHFSMKDIAEMKVEALWGHTKPSVHYMKIEVESPDIFYEPDVREVIDNIFIDIKELFTTQSASLFLDDIRSGKIDCLSKEAFLVLIQLSQFPDDIVSMIEMNIGQTLKDGKWLNNLNEFRYKADSSNMFITLPNYFNFSSELLARRVHFYALKINSKYKR